MNISELCDGGRANELWTTEVVRSIGGGGGAGRRRRRRRRRLPLGHQSDEGHFREQESAKPFMTWQVGPATTEPCGLILC